MEVHHHPEVGRKTFREYLLEGLMIFIAVTLGFFAEGLRERMRERQLEKEYIASFAEDLRIDTARINVALGSDIGILRHVNDLQQLMLEVPSAQADIVRAYKHAAYTWDQEDVHFSDRTYAQLRNSGDSRLLGSIRVSNAIQDYERGVRECEDQDAYYGSEIVKMQEVGQRIFLPRFRYLHYPDYFSVTKDTVIFVQKVLIDSLVAKEPIRFASTDPMDFTRYGNELGFYQGVLLSYIRMIQRQKKDAVALLDLLQNEYHLKPPAPGR